MGSSGRPFPVAASEGSVSGGGTAVATQCSQGGNPPYLCGFDRRAAEAGQTLLCRSICQNSCRNVHWLDKRRFLAGYGNPTVDGTAGANEQFKGVCTMISTKDLSGLPNAERLKNFCKGLAALDIIMVNGASSATIPTTPHGEKAKRHSLPLMAVTRA